MFAKQEVLSRVEIRAGSKRVSRYLSKRERAECREKTQLSPIKN